MADELPQSYLSEAQQDDAGHETNLQELDVSQTTLTIHYFLIRADPHGNPIN